MSFDTDISNVILEPVAEEESVVSEEEPVAEPVVEPVAEPVVEPPVAEPVVEPVAGPVVESAIEDISTHLSKLNVNKHMMSIISPKKKLSTKNYRPIPFLYKN